MDASPQHDQFVERFVQASSLERFDLVVHDWGAVALVLASRWPESVGRLVVIDAVPLTERYRWHWIARLWRRPVVGELLNATTTRFGTRQLLRQATHAQLLEAPPVDQLLRGGQDPLA